MAQKQALTSKHPLKQQRYLNLLKYVLFGSLGVGLFIIALGSQDLSQVWDTLMTADYFWLVPILGISLISNLARAIRWQMLLQPLGLLPSLRNAFAALMFGYLVNYALPRFGEISRCAALKKTDGLDFQPVFGTVAMERLVDIICLFLLLLITFWVEYDMVMSLYQKQVLPAIGAKAEGTDWGSRLKIAIAIFTLAIALLGWFGRKRWSRMPILKKATGFVSKVWQGFTAIRKMKRKGWYLALTAFIWFSYFLTTYLWFFSFPDTASLPARAGLLLMVAGTLGKTLPIQGGGMGAYHFLVGQGLLLYGVGGVHSAAMAILIHGSQTIYHLLVGLWAVITLAFLQKKS